MEKQLALVDPKEYGLEEKTAVEMTSGLFVTRSEREVLKQSYNELLKVELTVESVPMFKELRLKIVKNRTQGIEVWHKKNKAFYLAGGRFVDAIRNKEVLENEQMEAKLLEAETHFERIEAERLKALKEERIALLLIVCETPEIYPVEQMTTEAFDNLFEGLKLAKERKEEESKRIKKERIEAEKKAEIERLEKERVNELHFKRYNSLSKYQDYCSNIIDFHDTEFGKMSDDEFNKIESLILDAKKKDDDLKEKQRIENERLKAENEAKEKQLKEERLKAEQERKALEEKQRIENEAKEKALELERKKQAEIQAKKDAELQAEREKIQKLEQEKQTEINRLKAIDDEAKKHADKLAKSSDKVKLTVWVDSFELSSSDCTGISTDSKIVYDDIALKFENFKKWAKEQVNKL